MRRGEKMERGKRLFKRGREKKKKKCGG